ncbi:MAG TPA: fibronectin type III domain-containing protein [Prosthecobacter sp.]|nr:fibronectin type III domain-containing protein [Prosthecobacter sp.]
MKTPLTQPAPASHDAGLELALDFSPMNPAAPAPAPVAAMMRQDDRGVVKTGMDRMSDLALLEFVRNHLKMTEDNPALPDPQPPQETLEADAAALNESVLEVQSLMTALRSALTRKKTRRARLLNRMRSRAAYVQSASKGSKAVITSAGLGVRKERGRVGHLDTPGNLRTTLTANPGQMRIACKGVRHARVYELQYRRVLEDVEDPAEVEKTWRTLECDTRTRWLVSLEPGFKYAFRVCAIGSPGRSNWSPAVIRGAA